MPVKTTVRIDGLRQLGEQMRALGADVAQKIAVSATGAAAQTVKKRAVRNVTASPSVHTGSLRDAIIAKKVPKRQTPLTSEHVVTVRGRGKPRGNPKRKQSRAPHASLVEFGTVNMAAEPFLGPAFDSEKNRAVDAMAEKIRQRIAKVRAK